MPALRAGILIFWCSEPFIYLGTIMVLQIFQRSAFQMQLKVYLAQRAGIFIEIYTMQIEMQRTVNFLKHEKIISNYTHHRKM